MTATNPIATVARTLARASAQARCAVQSMGAAFVDAPPAFVPLCPGCELRREHCVCFEVERVRRMSMGG